MGVEVAVGAAILSTIIGADQAKQQRRMASQTADAARIDADHAKLAADNQAAASDAQAAQRARLGQERSAVAAKSGPSFGGTLLTWPLGTTGAPQTGGKTLLGA